MQRRVLTVFIALLLTLSAVALAPLLAHQPRPRGIAADASTPDPLNQPRPSEQLHYAVRWTIGLVPLVEQTVDIDFRTQRATVGKTTIALRQPGEHAGVARRIWTELSWIAPGAVWRTATRTKANGGLLYELHKGPLEGDALWFRPADRKHALWWSRLTPTDGVPVTLTYQDGSLRRVDGGYGAIEFDEVRWTPAQPAQAPRAPTVSPAEPPRSEPAQPARPRPSPSPR